MKIHMALPKRDAAIIAFKKALPERKFNETVIKILRAALKGVIPDEPISFEIDSGISKTSTKLDLPDDLVKAMRDKYKIKKGSFTTVIKKILKEYIITDRLMQVMDDFRLKMVLKEIAAFNTSDQHRKLCAFYELAMTKLYTALLDCMESATNSAANSKLLHLDTGKIVNDAFADIFLADETKTNHNEKETTENEQLFNL